MTDRRMKLLEKQREVFGTATLPEICMALKSSADGSSDPWSSPVVRETVEMLKGRIEEWEFTSSPQEKFDECVFHLVEATIRYVESYKWWT